MTNSIFALFADPVEHSLSPLIHHLAFEQEGRQARYFKVQANRNQLIEQFTHLSTQYGDSFMGANFSMPNKQLAMRLADKLDLSAKLTGAMNTIVKKEDQWIGYNTDGEGFIRSVERQFGTIKHSENWALIGTGGAARSITVAACLHGIHSVTLYATKEQYVESTKAVFEIVKNYSDTKIIIKLMDELILQKEIHHFDLLINTLGIHQNIISNKFEFPSKIKVVDVNYQPLQSNFLTKAKQQSCQTMNGIGMLIYQGILAYEHWTGYMPDVEPIFHLFDDYLTVHRFDI